MRLHGLALGGVSIPLLLACGGTKPSNECTPRDYLVSEAVHPFTATYGGHCAGLYLRSVNETVFRALGDEVHFQGSPSGESYGLWTSDGTAAGTRLLVGSTRYEAVADVPFVR